MSSVLIGVTMLTPDVTAIFDKRDRKQLPGVGCHRRQTTRTAIAARTARTARTARMQTQAWQASPTIATTPAVTTLVDDRDAATGLTGRLNARHNHNIANGNATANPITRCRSNPGSHKPTPRAWTTAKPTTSRPDGKRRSRSR
jgi:hypothetical protein